MSHCRPFPLFNRCCKVVGTVVFVAGDINAVVLVVVPYTLVLTHVTLDVVGSVRYLQYLFSIVKGYDFDLVVRVKPENVFGGS